ncbi:hypothetical protein CRENBAI_000859 [Crenichthys baileyi]|uniref:Uncharacterized protein n=1 Tax=Crenichthys baileyi TaxID=28760 RepID=A0AAV9RKV0_9TELE
MKLSGTSKNPVHPFLSVVCEVSPVLPFLMSELYVQGEQRQNPQRAVPTISVVNVDGRWQCCCAGRSPAFIHLHGLKIGGCVALNGTAPQAFIGASSKGW